MRDSIKKRTNSIRVPDGLETEFPLNRNQVYNRSFGEVGARPTSEFNDPHLYKVVAAYNTTYFDGTIQAITFVNSALSVLPDFVRDTDPSTLPSITTDGWGIGYNIYTGTYAWLANFTNLMSGGSDIPLNGICFAPAILNLFTASGDATPYDARIAVGVY